MASKGSKRGRQKVGRHGLVMKQGFRVVHFDYLSIQARNQDQVFSVSASELLSHVPKIALHLVHFDYVYHVI
jgi:hypothetical protein